MLGGTIPDEDDNDVIAEQLAKISEQMAIKNRRSKKIWKIAGVIFLVIVLLNILLIIFNMSVSKNVSTDSSTTFIEIGEDDVIVCWKLFYINHIIFTYFYESGATIC